MSEPVSFVPERHVLPDGREVDCVSDREAASAWAEIAEGEVYDEAAADLGPHSTVVDVGAHVGLTALHLADLAPGVRIVACEPTPPVFACLRANLARHVPSATPVQTALGAAEGSAELTYYPVVALMSTLRPDDEDDHHNMTEILRHRGRDAEERDAIWRASRRTAERMEVPVTTLDTLLDRHGVDEVDLLKIDVERSELDVLSGVGAERWAAIHRVVVEVHDLDGSLELVRGLLADRGFRVRADQDRRFAGTSVWVVTAAR